MCSTPAEVGLRTAEPPAADTHDELDLQALSRALAECGVVADDIPRIVIRLKRPPLSLRPSCLVLRGFNGDMAARLLCLDERKINPNAQWKMLSRARRKRATRLWALGKQRGRPTVIDPALVLYCARVICEASGRRAFGFSKSPNGNARSGPTWRPYGPMWRALIAAMPLALGFLARRYGTPAIDANSIGNHAYTMAAIIRLAQTRHFVKLCHQAGLGEKSADIECNPATFRYILMCARRASLR